MTDTQIPIDLDLIDRSFTSTRHLWRVESDDSHARTCVEELKHRLPHIPTTSWQERLWYGGVYLNRQPVFEDRPLQSPFSLEYYEPHYPISEASNLFPRFGSEMVLFSDDDLAIVFKPAGLPSVAPRDQLHHNLTKYLSSHFGKAVHLPSRLDLGVSGVMLVSLSSRTHAYLQRAYDRRRVTKEYIAKVSGVPGWSSTRIQFPLGRDPRHPVLRAVRSDGEAALTRFTELCVDESANTRQAFVHAEPITGRTHQIRVHCAASGHPIVGDPYYGASRESPLHLISYAISLWHPYRAESMRVTVPEKILPSWVLPEVVKHYNRLSSERILVDSVIKRHQRGS